MSAGIAGSLRDVTVAEVIQFIYIGRRTGTLTLTERGERARIAFLRGKLMAVQAPRTPKVGELLVETGVIQQKVLDAAVLAQTRSGERRAVGQILVARGQVSPEALRAAIEDQMKRAVTEVLGWASGDFDFAPDDLEAVDDIQLLVGAVLPEVNVNTHMVLTEAARIFEERNRPVAPSPAPAACEVVVAPPAPAPESLALAAGELAEVLEGLDILPEAVVRPGLELQVVSHDAALVAQLRDVLGARFDSVERLGVGRAGAPAAGAPPPVVLVDLRAGALDVEVVATLHELRPAASLVALIDPGAPLGPAYGAGVLAAVPAEPAAVKACVENILNARPDLARGAAPGEPAEGVARLRRAYGNLRSGLMSATAALSLLHVVSESVARAVLFLATPEHLRALGAFGQDGQGRVLAQSTRGLRLAVCDDHVLGRAVRLGEVQATSFAAAGLPDPLRSLLGEPASGQVVVFPVLGVQRVLAVIYADNGNRPEPIPDIELLELATAQVGMAFENELLRRQLPPR